MNCTQKRRDTKNNKTHITQGLNPSKNAMTIVKIGKEKFFVETSPKNGIFIFFSRISD